MNLGWTRTVRHMVTAVVMVSGFLTSQHMAFGQSACEEPTDSEYLEAMDATRTAITSEDYAAALESIEWALERYDFAILEYSRARALHRLQRYEEAREAYTTFLGIFEGCEDPNDFCRSARDYRSLAIREELEEPIELAPPELVPIETGSDEGVDPGWWVIGGGGLLVSVGLVFDFANHGLIDDLDAARAAEDMTAFNQTAGEIEDARVVEWVFLGTGMVALATGLVLLLTGSEEQTNNLAVTVVPDSAGGWATFGCEF